MNSGSILKKKKIYENLPNRSSVELSMARFENKEIKEKHSEQFKHRMKRARYENEMKQFSIK